MARSPVSFWSESKHISFKWTKPGDPKDIEKQAVEAPAIKPEDVCHNNFLLSLFGLPADQLRDWPGAHAYCQYVEAAFAPLLLDQFADLWDELETRRPDRVQDCWVLMEKTVTALRTLRDENSSLTELWSRIKSPISAIDSTDDLKSPPSPCSLAVFAAICWSTMTLQPILTLDATQHSLRVQQQTDNKPGLKMDYVRRPIPAIFRNFKKQMKTTPWRHRIGGSPEQQPTVLHVPSLNYGSLHTIGKIRLDWVDNLTGHLDFDAANRRLSVFKFPSFCALNALAESTEPGEQSKMPTVIPRYTLYLFRFSTNFHS